MEPTQEQIREVWEWCGATFRTVKKSKDNWNYPDGDWDIQLPVLDLNNLFKYAVPKFFAYDLHTCWSSCDTVTEDTRAEVIVNHKSYVSIEKDPALALFWAIWEAIKESE